MVVIRSVPKRKMVMTMMMKTEFFFEKNIYTPPHHGMTQIWFSSFSFLLFFIIKNLLNYLLGASFDFSRSEMSFC